MIWFLEGQSSQRDVIAGARAALPDTVRIFASHRQSRPEITGLADIAWREPQDNQERIGWVIEQARAQQIKVVLAGRVVYRDVLSPAQRLAVICAAVGVAAAIFNAGGLHWTALAVAFGYPPYFMLRRRLDLAHLGALWWDILLLWPLALWFLLRTGDSPLAPFASHPHLWLWVTLMGVFATLGLLFYILASRLLMFSLFGLLSYVEPVLLVLVAILLGERLAPHDWFTYVPIWLAVLALLVDGIRRLRNEAMRRNANMVQSPP